MPYITMHSDDGKEVARVQIRDLDPADVTIAILESVRDIPEPRKPRSDRGKKRVLPPAANSQEVIAA